MRVLIAGSRGQLGYELTRLGGQHQVLAVSHDKLDITDVDSIIACVERFHPDVVINAAAYTAVDRAESDVDAAFSVNCDGPANLARVCGEVDIPLIHVSTDYVFDGAEKKAYSETDSVAPLGVYGASKLAGELKVRKLCPKSIILRASWVFSVHGNNFVKTMLRLARDRDELSVVADQYGCPTAAAELARAIYSVLDRDLGNHHWGVYHFCQPDATTWFKFSEAIFGEVRRQGGILKVRKTHAIATEAYPTAAKRPVNSVMDCSKFECTFDFKIRSWSDSLAETVRELKSVER